MSDAFYRIVRRLGYPAFWTSSSPTVLHAERLDTPGAALVAPNHLSPYDVPCLMASTRQLLDFLSIVEIFGNRWASWFLGSMNAFPLDRGRVDPATTRKILERLARGRKVVMFPEGRICRPEQSLLRGGPFNPSVARVARVAKVPIIPCVLLATGAFARPSAWLPIRRTRYAVCFGHPLIVGQTDDEKGDCAAAVEQLKTAYRDLYAELSAASGLTVDHSLWRPAPSPAT